MSDFARIDRLIREAHVQRSAALGEALGTFLANTWLGTAEAALHVQLESGQSHASRQAPLVAVAFLYSRRISR